MDGRTEGRKGTRAKLETVTRKEEKKGKQEKKKKRARGENVY